jgi:segregation and condensation protein B
MVDLGLDDFSEPDDQGLSLDELSQAYAALLAKGADPFPQAEDKPRESSPRREVESDESEPVRRNVEPPCEVSPKTILEAILFVGHPANEPLTSERIAGLMRGVTPGEIDDLVGELNAEHAAAHAPYQIVSADCGYKMALRPEFASLRDGFYGRIREARLSQTAIDVLAIVAYQQPVTQAEIDRLRGRPSGPILSQLVRRDLLSVERPAVAKAKPAYRTTERFLDLFDLDDLSDLPRSQDLEREL